MSALIAPGTPIAVVAPCGVHDPGRFQAGLEIARAAGHDLRPFPDLLRPHRYLASPDDQRLAQLREALTDPGYGAVWIARGGYGLTRLLDRLDLEGLPRKPVIGFSDVTALHTALHQAGLGPAIHGPVVHSLPVTDAASQAHLWDLLAGRSVEALVGEPWVGGEARGPLVGGNLCLLAAGCGTRYQLDARGAILVLEDVGEVPFRLDRMLQQLRSAGVLDGVVGVAFGRFVQCNPPDGATWTLRDVLLEAVADLGVPVVGELPIGHGAENRAFVVGSPARLSEGRLILN